MSCLVAVNYSDYPVFLGGERRQNGEVEDVGTGVLTERNTVDNNMVDTVSLLHDHCNDAQC